MERPQAELDVPLPWHKSRQKVASVASDVATHHDTVAWGLLELASFVVQQDSGAGVVGWQPPPHLRNANM